MTVKSIHTSHILYASICMKWRIIAHLPIKLHHPHQWNTSTCNLRNIKTLYLRSLPPKPRQRFYARPETTCLRRASDGNHHAMTGHLVVIAVAQDHPVAITKGRRGYLLLGGDICNEDQRSTPSFTYVLGCSVKSADFLVKIFKLHLWHQLIS